jgi:hypothetical protein
MTENTDEVGMVKNGRVEIGKTPSVHSGEASEMIKAGEAITRSEEDMDVSLPVANYSTSAQFLQDLVSGDI